MLNWYLQSGKEADVVLSSRIRFARNLKDFNFKTKLSKEDVSKLEAKIQEIAHQIGYGLRFLKLKDMDDITIMSLVEKHLISPDFAALKEKDGAILINDDENICIMINEEDHLRIQVLGAGLELENTFKLAKEVDEKIGSLVTYAISEKYGYLTACPTNVGTAMRASVMVHLPALTSTGNIKRVLENINSLGMNIRGLYGEGTKSFGNIYQISNKQTLGITEEQIVKNLTLIAQKIIQQERIARKHLEKDSISLEDKIFRSYGVFSNCKKISSEEARSLLSDIRYGVALGIFDNLNDLKLAKLDLYTKPANLQKYVGRQIDAYERDIERAKIIAQIINEN